MMDLSFERHYPHPIDRVWKAITSSDALAQWLMSNDFKPEVGRSCTFEFCVEGSTDDHLVHVTVQDLRAPTFMRWRWRNEDESEATTVTFELEEVGDGTLLRIRHTGPASRSLAEGLEKGWPTKLGDLEAALSTGGASS